MIRTDAIVIIGAGHAGGRAVGALRATGSDHPIVLIGSEPHEPYERPPLSKEVLAERGDVIASEIHPRGFYQENNIDLRLNTRVERIATRAQRVWLDDGTSLPYGQLLLCTGASPRRLKVPGADSDRILYLRTRDDAETLRERLSDTTKLAVIGGGLIGLEVAAAARAQGCEVCVFEAAPALLERLNVPELSLLVRQMHERAGVEVATESNIVSFHQSSSEFSILLDDGSHRMFDLALVGIGVVPETELAERSGLRCENGIIVDEYCETSIPGIFAAGDVACRYDSTEAVYERLETWQNAEDQAVAVAATMAGQRHPYRPIPYVWTTQFGALVQFAGRIASANRTVARGKSRTENSVNLYLRGDIVVAILAIDAPKDFGLARRLIGANIADMDQAALSNERIPLKSLVADYVRSLKV